MKRILPLAFGLCSLLGYSQNTTNNSTTTTTTNNNNNNSNNNDEIKINLPYFIAGIPEASYEHIIDDTSAFGLSLAVAIDKPENVNTRFIVTPYYRLYFGKGKAKGFFIEGNAAVLNQKGYLNDVYDPITGTYSTTASGSTTNLGFGAAVGAKFLNKNGYIGEIYGGGGRLFGLEAGKGYNEGYPRVGVSIGKRF